MQAFFQSLIDHDGVVAVTLSTLAGKDAASHHGHAAWSPILAAQIAALRLTQETELRTLIGEHTILVQIERGIVVAVVIPTGHAIAKSLRRMIRRCARGGKGRPISPPGVEFGTGAPNDPTPTL